MISIIKLIPYMFINRLFATLFSGVLALSISAGCIAVDLLSVYQLAEKNDPVYLQEVASNRATLEARPQAMSQLLPSVSLSAETTRLDQDISSASTFGSGGEINYNNRGYSLSVTQPVYRRDRLIALEQADSEIKQAEAELIQAKQDLIVRIADSYFDVLSTMDNHEFAQAEVKSLSRQLEQANQRFEVGLSAITDVQEAQAGYDLAVAQEILALNAIDNSQEAMRELTGDYVTDLNVLGKNMTLVRPVPEAIENWTALSLEQNSGMVAARHATETARNEIKRQSAGHYPTLDLVGSHGYDSTGGRFGSTKTHASTIGLELNIPIYSGGLVSSQTREAHENYNVAMHALEQARRSAQRLTREAYLGVISGISQVKALNQAVISSETALEATEAGFEVGTRTTVDVVATQRTTSDARRNYSQAKYDYIINTLKLKQAAGTLSPDDLKLVNAWLTDTLISMPEKIETPVSEENDKLSNGESEIIVNDELDKSNIRNNIESVLDNWANAWSAQNIETYIASYSEDFEPPRKMTRTAWKKERQLRIKKPDFIKVTLSNIEMNRYGNDYAEIRFTQKYQSDTYGDKVKKEISMRKIAGTWLITQERTLQ